MVLAGADTLRNVATRRLHTQDTPRVVVVDNKGNKAVALIDLTGPGRHSVVLDTLDTHIEV